MDDDRKTTPEGWIHGGRNEESSLGPEERNLAEQLIALGKADSPAPEFSDQLATELVHRMRASSRPGKTSLRRQSLWRGLGVAWRWGLGLAGMALLAAVLIFSIGLLPRDPSAGGPAQLTLASQIPTPEKGLPTATMQPQAYTVQAGDTWASIADRFGTSVQELMAINGINDASELRVGQSLLIGAPDQARPGEPTLPTEAPAGLIPSLQPGTLFAVVPQDETRDVLVRSGPGIVYFPTEPLEPGKRVPIVGRSSQGDWLQLAQIGWVFFNQVKIEGLLADQTIQGLPVTSPLLPPEPNKPVLSQAACATSIQPADQPDFGDRPGLLIGGDTIQVGDFTLDLWLQCDSVFGASGGYLDAQSEIAGLGIYAGWTYHGTPQEGDIHTYAGFEPYVRPYGGYGDLMDGSGDGANLGLQFPLQVIPAWTQIDELPLRFNYLLQPPDGEALGGVLSFTLKREPQGFQPVEIAVAPWQGDIALLRERQASGISPVPTKDPAELYPIWKEAVDLLNGWQASLLSGPGWIHLVDRRFDSGGGNQLFGGRTEILSEEWYQRDEQGFVATRAHLDRGTDGTILQQSYTQDGRTVNLTFGIDEPADPAFQLDLASGYSQALLSALRSGSQIVRSETVFEGRKAIVYTWTQDPASPLKMEAGRLVAASARREILDLESGRPLVSELYETTSAGEERMVWKIVHETAERVQTLPQEVQDLLSREFEGYIPPEPEGTPAPAGFDVSQSDLTLRTIPGDSFERPTRFYGDIYAASGEAGEYLLGRVDFGAVPGGWCDRSADGARLAFTYQVMEGNSFTSATLRWLDLRAVDQVHEVAPELILLSPAAWSPTGGQIAFSACTDFQDGRKQDCGIYLYDLPSNQTRLLTQAGSTLWQLLWKPDGSQLAFVSTADENHEYFVLDVPSGDIRAQGDFNTRTWQFPAGSEVNEWGVTFPREMQTASCFGGR